MQADHKKIERLLKTARGQIDGILRMVEEDRYCMDISAQVMATDAILRKVNNEIIRAHMKGCVKSAILEGAGDERGSEGPPAIRLRRYASSTGFCPFVFFAMTIRF